MTLLSEVFGRRMRLVAPQTTDVVCERDLRATMDDGAVLLADRWAARASAQRRQPTVLVRSPYGRRQFVGLMFGRLLAERGLQVVVQSVRGTFGSDGEFAPFDERADGAATLRWLAAEPWHDGRVATFGPSYLGLVQWALAGTPEAGDALRAMAIQVSASEFHGQTYAGGSVSLETIASWLIIIATQERRLAPLRIDRALRGLSELLADQPLVELDERVTGAPVTWVRESFAQPARDGVYWGPRDYSAEVGDVEVPVSFVGGWHDILTPWMLDDFGVLQAAGRAPRLLIGPWTHTSPELVGAGHREGIAFLRAHLLDDERLLRDDDRSLPVRLRITGEGGGWRDYATWPPGGTRPLELRLRGGGLLSDDPAGDAEAGDRPDRYRYDPADPTPSFGGPVLMSRVPVVDNGRLEARDDVLSYTGEPLPGTLEVIGRPHVRVWVRGSAPHFDVFARLCEVDAAGVSRNVCDALWSIDPARDRAADDGSVCVEFQLWPLGHRFAAGSRLRVQISSGAYPRYARNPGTGEDPAGAALATMRAVEVEVLHDAEHPSSITLPVMPPDADPARPGRCGADVAGDAGAPLRPRAHP